MKKVLILLLSSTIVLFTPRCFAVDYTITPLKMEIMLPEKGVLVSGFKVNSNSDHVIKLQTSIKSWSLNRYGAVILVDSPSNFNVSENVRLNPEQFELRPHESKFIRFAVKVPPELANGEYRFQIALDQREALAAPTTVVQINKGLSANLQVSVRFALTVYAYKGKHEPQVAARDFSCGYDPGKTQITNNLTLDNTGTQHARLKATLVLNQKDPSDKLAPMTVSRLAGDPVLVVVPDAPRDIGIPINPDQKITPGNYRLEMRLTDTRNIQPAIQSNCDFTVSEPMPVPTQPSLTNPIPIQSPAVQEQAPASPLP